jgi:hypothetical protein
MSRQDHGDLYICFFCFCKDHPHCDGAAEYDETINGIDCIVVKHCECVEEECVARATEKNRHRDDEIYYGS